MKEAQDKSILIVLTRLSSLRLTIFTVYLFLAFPFFLNSVRAVLDFAGTGFDDFEDFGDLGATADVGIFLFVIHYVALIVLIGFKNMNALISRTYFLGLSVTSGASFIFLWVFFQRYSSLSFLMLGYFLTLSFCSACGVLSFWRPRSRAS